MTIIITFVIGFIIGAVTIISIALLAAAEDHTDDYQDYDRRQ